MHVLKIEKRRCGPYIPTSFVTSFLKETLEKFVTQSLFGKGEGWDGFVRYLL